MTNGGVMIGNTVSVRSSALALKPVRVDDEREGEAEERAAGGAGEREGQRVPRDAAAAGAREAVEAPDARGQRRSRVVPTLNASAASCNALTKIFASGKSVKMPTVTAMPTTLVATSCRRRKKPAQRETADRSRP